MKRTFECRDSEMRRAASVFAACLVTTFQFGVAWAQDDHGDRLESATLLAIGPPEIGTINGADDVDYYRIDLAGSATVTVATAGPTDTQGELLDGSGALIDSDSDSGPGGNNFQLTAALEAGVYYVAVSGSEGGYALTALLADAGDQGGTAASSVLLTLYGAAEVAGVTAIGSSALLSTVGSIDEAMTDLDYFRIDVPTGGTDVTVRSAGGTDTAGRLLDSALVEVAADDGGDGNFRIEATLDAGIYYLEVTGEMGRYRVIASGSDADCPCAGEAMAIGDHGDTDETSTLMPIGPPLTGEVAGADDADVFRIDLAGDATVAFETAGPTDTMGTLRDGAGTELATADGGGPAMNFRIVEELAAGVYYLEVSGPAGSYAVSAQLGGGDSDHGDTAGLSTLLTLYSQDDVDNIKPSALLSTAAEIDAAETDIDVFRLDVPMDMTDVTIRSAGALDTYAYLRDADGMELAMDDSDGAFRIEATLDAGVYYVEVGGHETGRYRVLAWGDSQVECSCGFHDSWLTQLYRDSVLVMHAEGRIDPYDFRVYAQHFYLWFDDAFDVLIFIPITVYETEGSSGGWPYNGLYSHVSNDVRGIGKRQFSVAGEFGSSGRLKGVIHLPWRKYLVLTPLLHELMHMWANYAVETVDRSHLSYTWGPRAFGHIGGFDSKDVIDHGGGLFGYDPSRFQTVRPYSDLELYFAGLGSATEVPPRSIAKDAELLKDQNGQIQRDEEGRILFTALDVREYSIHETIAEHGPRKPDFSAAPRKLRAAVILLTEDMDVITPEVLDRTYQFLRASSSSAYTDDYWTFGQNYAMATKGRGKIEFGGLGHHVKVEPMPNLRPPSFGNVPASAMCVVGSDGHIHHLPPRSPVESTEMKQETAK